MVKIMTRREARNYGRKGSIKTLSVTICFNAISLKGPYIKYDRKWGEGGVSLLRSDAFIRGEGVQGLEVDRKEQSKVIVHKFVGLTFLSK